MRLSKMQPILAVLVKCHVFRADTSRGRDSFSGRSSMIALRAGLGGQKKTPDPVRCLSSNLGSAQGFQERDQLALFGVHQLVEFLSRILGVSLVSLNSAFQRRA